MDNTATIKQAAEPAAEDTVEDSDLLEMAFNDPQSLLATSVPENAWVLFKLWHKHRRPVPLRTARGDKQRVEGWVRARQHLANTGFPAPVEAVSVRTPVQMGCREWTAYWAVTVVDSAVDFCDGASGGIVLTTDVPGDPTSEWTWKVVR